jgi:hypothetical protein
MPQTFDPNVVVAPVIYPRQVAGFRRLVQMIHPMCGMETLLSTDASFNDTGSPNYTKYALTPGVGPKQKAIHTAGTREVTWSVGGEITAATLGLLELLKGSARGVNFRQLLISQGNANYFLDNPNGNSLPWNQFSVNGNQNAGLTFTLEGKSTIDAVNSSVPITTVGVSTPVASWTTGNDLVLSWSLSHNVNLQPYWFNNPNMLPAYYRALDSEFTLQLTTAVALSYYTLIKIGFGYVNYAEMVVTSENITYGDRNSPVTYEVSSSNAAVANQANAYVEYVNIFLNGVPDAGYS